MTTTAYGEYSSQYSYASVSYASRTFTQGKNADFYGNVSAAATKTTAGNESRVIGLTTIPYSDMMSYGMKAQYAPESTKENPIIQVTSNYGGETVSYNVNVNEVNPQNASQLEMFALLSYADDAGISKGGTFGSYQQMKTYSYNACENGYIAGYSVSSFSSYETFMTCSFNWTGIVSRMMEDYLSAGIYDQSRSCKNLLDVFGKFEKFEEGTAWAAKTESSKTTASDSAESGTEAADKSTDKEDTITDYLQLIRDRINEMYDKVKNNETEESFQIGAGSFTEKEWSKLLEEFDDIQETIRELMREEHAKRQEKQAEREEMVDALVSESVVSKYTSETEDADRAMYITWYNEDGMFCRKAGMTEGYEWTISFDSLEQYRMIEDFMKRFDSDDNLKFASNQSFWQDFLNDMINADEVVASVKEADGQSQDL